MRKKVKEKTIECDLKKENMDLLTTISLLFVFIFFLRFIFPTKTEITNLPGFSTNKSIYESSEKKK